MTLQEQIARFQADEAISHAIIHGADDAVDVTTDGGPVAPLAKQLKEVHDYFMSGGQAAIIEALTDEAVAAREALSIQVDSITVNSDQQLEIVVGGVTFVALLVVKS